MNDRDFQWLIICTLLLVFIFITFVGYSILNEVEKQVERKTGCDYVLHYKRSPELICD